jgi:hypothetical protein
MNIKKILLFLLSVGCIVGLIILAGFFTETYLMVVMICFLCLSGYMLGELLGFWHNDSVDRFL